jgi:DNA-directed RNA polymerase subunit RPC12/RpoP
MIRFKCPACQKILKVPDEGAGRKINCPKCGQRMLIPAPKRPATTNKTMLAQLAPSPAPVPTTPSHVETDSLVLLGLRKDSEPKGSSKEQRGYKPTRSWAGTLCALVALALTTAATPVAVLRHPLIGAGLAAFAVLLALFAVFKSMFRKGLGLASIALMLGGAVLFGIVALSGGPALLLKPVKDRLAALSQRDPLERKEERPTPTAHNGSEAKSETNQPAEKDWRKEDRKSQRREEKGKEQSGQSEREAAPTADKTPPKKGPKLDADELHAFHRWMATLPTELGSPNDNLIRYRANLQKAEERAQAYTRDFTAREVALAFDLPVYRIEESHIYLNGNFDVYQVVLKGEERDGTLSLKVGQDISKDAAIELKRDQTINIRADVVSVSVQTNTAARQSVTSVGRKWHFGPYVQITVRNLRLDEGQKKNEENSVRAEKKGAEKSKSEDDGQPRFDPNDLQRTVRWGWTIVERLEQDVGNAIRYRTTLERLSKNIRVHENAKVRWQFVVVSIGENRVELWGDRQNRNFFLSKSGPLSIITDNRPSGSLSLSVGQGISKQEAAKLKPRDTITVRAKVADLRLDRGSLTIVLKDLRVAEARKQPREESTKEVEGAAAPRCSWFILQGRASGGGSARLDVQSSSTATVWMIRPGGTSRFAYHKPALLRVSQERGTSISKTITSLQLCLFIVCRMAHGERLAACNHTTGRRP